MPGWDEQNALVELTAKVASMEKQTMELEAANKKAEEEKEKMDKEAATKKAMEDKEKEEKEAKKGNLLKGMDDDHSKKMEAALMTAMDETDPEKRKAAVKKAMDDNKMNEKKEGMSDDDKKKMDEQKAQIENLTKIAAEPKVTYLAQVYAQTGLAEEKITEMKAAWEKMPLIELEAEVAKIAPFVKQVESTAATTAAPGIPVGPSVNPLFSGSVAKPAEFIAKIEKADGAELFNGGIA